MSERHLPDSVAAEARRLCSNAPATIDHDAWISALSGHVATSPRGDRIWARTRNPHAGLAAGRVAANIEFHSPEYIGYARLRLRHDPEIGLVVMINTIHLDRTTRGLGIGGSIVASWAQRLRALGVAEMQFEAVRDGHFTSGRLFWARDGVLFRDPGQPHRLLDRLAGSEDAGAIGDLRRRIDRGELSTPADLYRDPRGRRALGAGDWSGRWPLARGPQAAAGVAEPALSGLAADTVAAAISSDDTLSG